MPIGSARERNITIEYGYSSCDNTEEEWEEEDEEDKLNVRRSGRQRNRKSATEHYPRPHSHLFRTKSGKRARGNKHIRRWENSAFLSTLHQVTEEDLAEDHSLILPPHTSSFKQLLTDTSQLMKWHTFAELPEDQQTKYVSSSSHPHAHTKKSTSVSGVKRIDRSIRSALTHNKRTPVEYIESLEKEAMELFRDDNSSTVVFLQPSGFHRMMLHAVCQYLGLLSKTEMWDGKALMVVVECASSVFCPPDTALSTMLHQGTSLMAL